MAEFNQVGEFAFAQILARRLTTPDPNPAPQVEPGLFPTLVLENDRSEWGWLGGTKLMMGCGVQALDVANLSSVSIGNPVGSRSLVMIEYFNLNSATSISVFRVGPMAGTLGFSQPVDTRWANASQQTSVAIISQQVAAALPPSFECMRFGSASGSSVWHPCKLVLSPGHSFQFINRAINNAINVGFQWYERTAQPSELV